jgi:hypothetical protein
MAHGNRSLAPNIDEVRSRFERWRQTRWGKARIPIELEDGRGKLRVHSKGATPADSAELSWALWGLAA